MVKYALSTSTSLSVNLSKGRGGACLRRQGTGRRMFYVYIIKSLAKNWMYVGNTSNLEVRLNKHSNGSVKSTKPYRPLELIFAQILSSRNDARDLEKFLKIRWNKESLLEIIK